MPFKQSVRLFEKSLTTHLKELEEDHRRMVLQSTAEELAPQEVQRLIEEARITPPRLLRDEANFAVDTSGGDVSVGLTEPHLSAEDIALGYKQLLEVERGRRDMKQILDLRPVHHRLEDRIRAHVVLCWLALLLIRIIETTTGDTWNNVHRELQRLTVGTFTGPVGTYRQSTQLTDTQRQILQSLDIPAPPRILQLGTQPTD